MGGYPQRTPKNPTDVKQGVEKIPDINNELEALKVAVAKENADINVYTPETIRTILKESIKTIEAADFKWLNKSVFAQYLEGRILNEDTINKNSPKQFLREIHSLVQQLNEAEAKNKPEVFRKRLLVFLSNINAFSNIRNEQILKELVITDYAEKEGRLGKSVESTCTKEIEGILFSLPLGAPDGHINSIIDYLTATKGRDIDINILLNKSSEKDILMKNPVFMKEAKGRNIQYRLNPHAETGSHWIRDGAIMLTNNVVLEPIENLQYNSDDYEQIPVDQINDHRTTDLWFEGGNIRSDETHAYIGIDTLLGNILIHPELKDKNLTKEDEVDLITTLIGTEHIPANRAKKIPVDPPLSVDHPKLKKVSKEVLSRFKKLLGKEIIILGMDPKAQKALFERGELKNHTSQSHFHIDMMIAALGDGLIAIGKETVLEEIQDPKLKSVSQANQQEQEETKKILTQAGKRILEVPQFDHFSYTNVLVEKVNKQRVIYVPQYRWEEEYASSIISKENLEALNKKALAAYKSIPGADVKPIRVRAALSYHGGSLNCITFETRK